MLPVQSHKAYSSEQNEKAHAFLDWQNKLPRNERNELIKQNGGFA